ncbi:preprotein translocase subunit SecG [Wolbachia pipientis]|uniref:Protein-export membrane protein SecG n=1 Tax=Wolbachia pipientis TaxID=955 RepID=A0A1E7QK88_WOLPI|nr:preprotein translocase subunit SecG [Wolbachia pipientis]OEY86863.1 preprotein translocase subunit SecG [Wolbachia pipientis]
MSTTILVICQIVLVIILIIVVLLQPPGGNSLSGFSSSQQGFNSLIPIKSSMDTLNKATSIVALLFIINTLLLSGMYSKELHKKSIAEKIELAEKKQKATVPFGSE